MLGPPFDVYAGWIVQPINERETNFYVYENKDPYKQDGYYLTGSRISCFEFLDELLSLRR